MVMAAAPLQNLCYDGLLQVTSGGNISLPVPSNQVIYAHFEHVDATPAEQGQAGVSVSELQILDALVERLIVQRRVAAEAADMAVQKRQETLLRAAELFSQKQVDETKQRGESLPYTSVEVQGPELFDLRA